MTDIVVLGAGAYGTALAIALARNGRAVTLWTRDPGQARAMADERENHARLPGISLGETITVTSDLGAATDAADVLLLAVPMQQLRGFVEANAAQLRGKTLVSCCKGIDLETGQGPAETLLRAVPDASHALLSGPSFAEDIARGLPTALTLAARDEGLASALQTRLATDTLRIYRSGDVTGVELGGALKNVMAIACGIAMGAGLGESARAALITRGFSEMTRFATALGAQPSTLAGLSGLGDLVLTCTSEKSRNYRHGLALGRRAAIDPAVTVEGVPTARAVAAAATKRGIDMPIAKLVSGLLEGDIAIEDAMDHLLSRPLKKE